MPLHHVCFELWAPGETCWNGHNAKNISCKKQCDFCCCLQQKSWGRGHLTISHHFHNKFSSFSSLLCLSTTLKMDCSQKYGISQRRNIWKTLDTLMVTKVGECSRSSEFYNCGRWNGTGHARKHECVSWPRLKPWGWLTEPLGFHQTWVKNLLRNPQSQERVFLLFRRVFLLVSRLYDNQKYLFCTAHLKFHSWFFFYEMSWFAFFVVLRRCEESIDLPVIMWLSVIPVGGIKKNNKNNKKHSWFNQQIFFFPIFALDPFPPHTHTQTVHAFKSNICDHQQLSLLF